jgi:predicted N-acyltransferase
MGTESSVTAIDLRSPRRPPSTSPAIRRDAHSHTIDASAVDELAAVPPAEWDALARRGGAALTHGYLRAWEHCELRGLRSRPVIAHDRDTGEAVGACPGYLYDLDLPTARSPQAGAAVGAIRRVLPSFLFARTYELGSPTPLTNPFLVANREQRPEVVGSLIAAALEEAQRTRSEFTLVQNFTSRDTPGGEQLARLGFAGIPIPATTVVDLPYASFDDYLGAMRAQYRRRAQKTLKRTGELTVEHVVDFADCSEELARLWRAIYERATEVKREVLTPRYFRAVSALPHASVLLIRRSDKSIASFALLLDDHPWLSFLQCGFEQQAGRGEGAYFRLLYEIVRFGIERGYQQVELGMTTLIPKLDVGAVPVALFAWVKHRNPLLRRVLRSLANGPLRPDDVEPRRVFKESPPAAAELVARRDLID